MIVLSASSLVYSGEVTEWLKVHAWNACVRKYREFESHPLRQGFKMTLCLSASGWFQIKKVKKVQV